MNRGVNVLMHAVTVTLLSFYVIKNVAAETITVRADKHGFPVTFMRDSKWEGIDVDLIRELLSRTKLAYEFAEIPFPRSLIQIQDGTIQVIPNLVKNEERSDYMNWLGPTRITCIGLVVQEKHRNLPAKTTDDLIRIAKQQQQQLGYLTGASYSPYFDERLKHDSVLNDALYFLSDNEQHRHMLKLGRLLGYFYDAFEVQKRLLDATFSADYEGLALHDYRMEESCIGAYIGISKKLDNTTYQRIMQAFQSMKDDGTFSEIHLRWVGRLPDF